MAIQRINIGTNPNDGTGDQARTAFGKANDNFADLDVRTTAAQTTGNTARTEAAAASTSAAAANSNANTRILTSARNVANGVANLNPLLRLNYALEILMAAQAGNNGRVFIAPAGLHNNNSGTSVGCYVIKLSSVTAMHTVHARAFNYGAPPTRGVVEFTAGLYNTTGTASGTWPSSSLSHFGSITMPVSFAIEIATGRRCVIVGKTDTPWVFGMLEVLDVTSHRSTIAGVTGTETVNVEFVTNLDAYAGITEIPDNGPYATANAALALGQAAYPLLGVIPIGSDFNNLTQQGISWHGNNVNVGNMANRPAALAGNLRTMHWNGTNQWPTQEYITYGNAPRYFLRSSSSATQWSAYWHEGVFYDVLTGKLKQADFPLMLDKQFAASSGSGTAGGYIGTLAIPATNTALSTGATGMQISGQASGASIVIAANSHSSVRFGARVSGVRTTAAPDVLTTPLPANMSALTLQGLGADGVDAYRQLGTIDIMSDGTAVSPTDSSGRIEFRPTPAGSIIPATAASLKSTQLLLSAGVQLAVGTGGITNSGTTALSGGTTITGSLAVPAGTTGLTKASVGLLNVDNTPDSGKPVSAAQQTALNAKANLAGGNIFTGGSQDIRAETYMRQSLNMQWLADPGTSTSPLTVLHCPSGYKPHFRSNSANGGRIEFVNSANNLLTAYVSDGGTLTAGLCVEVNTNSGAAPKASFRGFGTNQNEGISLMAGVAGNAYPIVFRNAGQNVVGSIMSNDSSTAFNTTSDERLKDKFREFDAYTIVDMMAMYEFEFLSEPGIKHYGAKAAELQLIFPCAVTGRPGQLTPDGRIDPQQVDYSKKVPVLVRHAQQTASRIRGLEALVASQAHLIESFELRLAALEQ